VLKVRENRRGGDLSAEWRLLISGSSSSVLTRPITGDRGPWVSVRLLRRRVASFNVSWFRLLEHQRCVKPVHSTGWHNGPMNDAAPVRITFERGSSAAVNRRFIGGFFAFAILFAGAAFYRPAIQAFAAGFPVFLVLWKLRLRSASRPGWALVISGEDLRVEGDRAIRDIVRTEVTRVGIVSARSQARLLALNGEGKAILRLPIAEESRRPIEDALRGFGWPVGGSKFH
jgi:hypothetical protein